jgi:hypothetical protein
LGERVAAARPGAETSRKPFADPRSKDRSDDMSEVASPTDQQFRAFIDRILRLKGTV